MIDYHTHILPQIDDGASNVSEAIKMIQCLEKQGVKEIVATPHFNCERHTIPEFLMKRKRAWDELSKCLDVKAPKIRLGAEVYFSTGLVEDACLKDLCIEGSNQILIEMPFRKWRSNDVNMLLKIRQSGFEVVLAHIDRYLEYENDDVFAMLSELEFIFQVNYSSLRNRRNRKKIFLMKDEGASIVYGSDCHNMGSRSPIIKKALKIIEKETKRRV